MKPSELAERRQQSLRSRNIGEESVQSSISRPALMLRYFFDVHDRNGVHHDEIGDCFSDVEEARAVAQSILPDIARRELPKGDRHVVACDVRDEAGRVVYRCELIFQESWASA